MFGKIIALVAALAAVATAEPCGIAGGYLSTGMTGYGLGGCGSRVMNVGCSVPVVSATPSCAPIATPSVVVDPIPTAVAPVVSSGLCGAGVYGSGLYGSGLYGSGLYGAGAYGAGVYGGYGYGSVLGGCGTGILPSVC